MAHRNNLVVERIRDDIGEAEVSGEQADVYNLISSAKGDMVPTLLDEEIYAGSPPSDNLSKYDKYALYIIELISTPATREAVIGDLLEARDEIMEQHGERKARFYFWWQVLRTIGHFAYAWVRRLRWIAVALGFMGWMARKFSS